MDSWNTTPMSGTANCNSLGWSLSTGDRAKLSRGLLITSSPDVLKSEQLMGACEHAHNATRVEIVEILVNAVALRNKEIKQFLNNVE